MKKKSRKIKEKKRSKSRKKNIRKFLIKYKKIIIAFVSVFLLLLSFGVYRTWLNIHFLVSSDLNIILEPNDLSLYIHYDEKPNVSFNVNIEKSIFCNTFCSYEFNDLSAPSLIEKGNFTTNGSNKSFSRNYVLSVRSIGAGQNIYSFNVKCSNIRTWHCLTNEIVREKTAFVTLNYDISEYEKSLKTTLMSNLTKILNELSELDIKIQKFNNKFFELGFTININEISKEKEILNNDFSDIVIEAENLKRTWSSQNYTLLSELFDRNFSSRIYDGRQRLENLNAKMDGIVEKHNNIIESLNNADNSLRELNETLLFLHKSGNTALIEEYNSTFKKISKIKNKIVENTFSNYSYIEDKIREIKNSFEKIKSNAKDAFIVTYTKGAYYLALEKDILCSIKGICAEQAGLSSIITYDFSIDNKQMQQFCSSFDEIANIHNIENNKSIKLMENYPNQDEIKSMAEKIKNKKIAIIINKYYEEAGNMSADNNEQNISLNMLVKLIPNLNASIHINNYSGFSENEILPLIQLNLTNNSIEYYNNYCLAKEGLNLIEYYGNQTTLQKVSVPENKNFSSRIDVNLTDNYPVCCIFGECKQCCNQESCSKDPLLYPVLFLHGHALNSDNSPDYSLDAFNKLIARLEKDGYINAGTITPISDYSEIKQGEWGLSSKPIIVKGSYYLVSYYNVGKYAVSQQKSENIETYAIRLKELIDLLKFRTGKDKVIIIAHSMGGLVARSYMQIFGDSSVYKLIMIATPNKGISGSISDYCPVLGEKKECEDMSQDSIFIKKINGPLNVPKNAKLYNIIGIGCNMDNSTGDGIVLKENAALEYAENFYVYGGCAKFLKLLHTQILDTETYTVMYDYVKEALKN